MENSIEPQSKRSLRNLLIEPLKQIRFGVYFIIITIAYTFATALLLINSFYEQYQHVMALFNVVDPHLRWELISDEVFYSNIFKMAVCFFLFLFIMFATILRLTHRIYGPLVSIKRFLNELKSGNYSARVILRKDDDLQDLVKELNELAETLEKKAN